LREQSAAFADVFGFFPIDEIVARAGGDPFTTSGTMVSDNFFPTLGVKPVIGRLFQPGDDNPSAGPNLVISYESWEKHFGGAPDVLGRTVVLNVTPFTIIGVLPRDFCRRAAGPFTRILRADAARLAVPVQGNHF